MANRSGLSLGQWLENLRFPFNAVPLKVKWIQLNTGIGVREFVVEVGKPS
jgi:hypothetical protein